MLGRDDFSLVEAYRRFRAAWYLRHHISDDRVACFIVLRWRQEGRSESSIHFYQTTRLYISDDSGTNILKFSRGVKTLLRIQRCPWACGWSWPRITSPRSVVSNRGDWAADKVCWSNSDNASRSWTARERNERAGIMQQSNKCVIYEWRFRPPVITSPSREPRGRPALYHRGPRARVPCMDMGGRSAPSAEAAYQFDSEQGRISFPHESAIAAKLVHLLPLSRSQFFVQ